MITISDWFKVNATRQIFKVILISFLLCLSAIYYNYILLNNEQTKIINQLTTLTSIAYLQKNRVILESVISLSVEELNSVSVTVCKNNIVLVSAPGNILTCNQDNISIFYKKIIVPLTGFEKVTIQYIIPKFKYKLILFLFISITLVLFLLISYILLNVKSSINNDILVPLKDSLYNKTPLQIYELEEIRKLIFESNLLHLKQKISSALIITSTQVAHDIRSPLAALEMITNDLSQLPEDKRILLRSAVTRIKDIANDLLLKNKISNNNNNIDSLNFDKDHLYEKTSQLISVIIDSIVSEKRLQYRGKVEVVLESQFDNLNYGIFAEIESKEFKRVLSNLINNSVESIRESGSIIIKLESYNESITISIIDNGSGISSEILPKLMKKGETFGKKNGSGLGLYHAKETIEAFSGKLEIESEFGKGTKVKITLPRAKTPHWFLEELKIFNHSKIIIIDDDQSVHEIWKERFSHFKSTYELLHFFCPQDFEKWIQKYNKTDLNELIFLCDFEFLNDSINGLELIEKNNIASQSYLVTSRFEDKVIRENCKRLGIKLIPKEMSGFIPISLEKPKLKPDTVLVDDDEMIHLMWKVSADKNKKVVHFYYEGNELLNNINQYNFETSFYIDSNLKNNEKGEDVAKKLYDLGYKELYLATGYDKSDFPSLPFIKGFVGKKPIF